MHLKYEHLRHKLFQSVQELSLTPAERIMAVTDVLGEIGRESKVPQEAILTRLIQAWGLTADTEQVDLQESVEELLQKTPKELPAAGYHLATLLRILLTRIRKQYTGTIVIPRVREVLDQVRERLDTGDPAAAKYEQIVSTFLEQVEGVPFPDRRDLLVRFHKALSRTLRGYFPENAKLEFISALLNHLGIQVLDPQNMDVLREAQRLHDETCEHCKNGSEHEDSGGGYKH